MTDTTTPATWTDRRRERVVELSAPDATDRELVGGKAAALARAVAAGVPTVPGVVLTTAFCEEIDAGGEIDGHPAVAEAFGAFGDRTRVVARSSSVVEDDAESSAAGQFESVIGIDGVHELEDAVRVVLDSRERAGATDHPIAVLVQPIVEPTYAGVLFGVDPVTGRRDRRVVNAVEGRPDALVSGQVEGSSYELRADGAVVDRQVRHGVRVPTSTLVALARLADQVAEVFGAPQDVEWAVVDEEVVLLQSRPVTTEVRGTPHGPVYGPGPVAETFPERLSPLEQELWIPPLQEAVREALRLAGAVPEKDLDGPPLVTVVGGWAAIDLERTGEIETGDHGSGLGIVGRIRRLRSAWRLGRLRSALPELGHRLLQEVDGDLEDLPSFGDVSHRQLVGVLARTREALRAVHAHEMLMGLLGGEGRSQLTGASVAMRVLTEARIDGRSDAEILATSPVVLALTPPRICAAPQLPDDTTTPDIAPPVARAGSHAPGSTDPSVIREALRLRVRWLQELSARAAWELGRRLRRDGVLDDADDVRWLSLDDLVALCTARAHAVPGAVRHVAERHVEADAGPLPARFRLSDEGEPVPYVEGGAGGGTGAGGARGHGPVTHDAEDPPEGSVLVVTTLHPGIGPLLPRLNGLVAETGSVLAHLAILARESGVPTVVGHAGAVDQLDEGRLVTVDGHSGEVSVDGEDDEEDPS